MKKYLIVLAAAVVALASCNNGGVKYTSIAFESTELTMGEYTTASLQVFYEPVDAVAPECVWSSSNDTIVAVDEFGNLEALSIGEAIITATLGEGEDKLTAVCKVTVKNRMDIVAWGGFGCFDHDVEPLSNDTFVTTLSTGEEVHCVMVKGLWYLWDANVIYNNGLKGSGYLVEAEGTVWCITDSIDQNGPNYYYLSNRKNTLQFKDYDTFDWHDTTNVYCAVTGKPGDAEKQLEWYNDETATVEDATEMIGAQINSINFDAGRYTGIFLGFPAEGLFLGNRNVAYYQANFKWFDYQYTAYGLLFEYDEEQEDWFPKEPAEWGPLYDKYYESLPESSVMKFDAPEAVAPLKANTKKAIKDDVLVKLSK